MKTHRITRRQCLAAVGGGAVLAGRANARQSPRDRLNDRLYDPGDGLLGVRQGTLGMRGLHADQVYRFQAEPAKRVVVSEPPCGKPVIEALKNGDLLAAYSRNYWGGAGPREKERPLMNEVRWSSDGGLTWSEPVRPFSLDQVGPTYEGRLIVFPDGRLVIASIAVKDGNRPGPYLSVSTDHGRHWSPPWKLDLSIVWPDGHGWPTRQNIVNPDGSLVLMCNNYARDQRQNWRCFAFHLDPDLRTLRDHWLIGMHCHDQSFVRLESGKWVAIWRIDGLTIPRDQLPYGYVPEWDDGNEGHDFLAATESPDGGRSWSVRRPVTGYMEVPGHLLQLRDGRLLLTYGVRHYPMGAQALLSRDEGLTWEKEDSYMLAWHGAFFWNSPGLHPYPNGHPYSAQRQDGDIISVYYRAADPKDYRSTLVEAVIWKLPPQ
ncbi:MAG: sialidase family protein [Acidobacteriota bacterium]